MPKVEYQYKGKNSSVDILTVGLIICITQLYTQLPSHKMGDIIICKHRDYLSRFILPLCTPSSTAACTCAVHQHTLEN